MTSLGYVVSFPGAWGGVISAAYLWRDPVGRVIFVASFVVAVAILHGGTAFSQAVYRSSLIADGRLRNDVSTEVSTPHIPWARPLVGNSIKVLFIGPAYGHRETAEVAQRLSIEYDVLFSGTTTSWTQPYLVVGQSRNDDVLAQLRAKLAIPRDCVVIGNLDWDLLPDDVVESIGLAVADGMGLVYVMYDQEFPPSLLALMERDVGAPDTLANVPIEQLQTLQDADGQPVLTSLPEVQNYKLGKGRVTLIRYPDVPAQGVHFLTPDPNHAIAYEYCQSFFIKQLCYTAGRESAIRIETIDLSPQIQSSELLATSARLKILGNSNAPLVAKWSIRNHRGETLAGGSQDIEPAATGVAIALRHLPAGLNFLDVSLQNSSGEILDWGSASFNVISARSIADIHLLNDTISPDGDIAGHVALNGGTSELPLPDGCSLRLKLFDNEQRLYADVSLPDRKFVEKLGAFAQSRSLWFSLPVADGLTTIQRVRAELRDGDGNVLSVAEREFYVPRYPKDDFIVGVWGTAERVRRWSHIADQLSRHQKKIGIDAELVGHFYVDPSSKLRMSAGLTRANISVYPYVERISNFETSLVRNPCLTDPVFLKRRLAEHREWAHGLGKLGCIAFNLGDEVNLSAQGIDVCFSPTCQASFRTWLEKAYGSIDRLNQSWGTQYRSWNEAGPITQADAKATDRMAQWLDHRLHMTDVMMNYMRQVADVYTAEIPGARSGPEGIWGTDPYFGVDWGQLAARLEVVIPYMDEPLAFTAATSLAREGSLSGTWMGGYPHRGMYEGMARYDPWYALLHGLNSAWYYCNYDGTTTIHPYGAFAPDFRLNQAGEWFFDEIARIKSGLGKLILESRRERDGIAILYSSPSAYLQPGTGSDLILAIRDAGYQVDVITIPQVIGEGLQQFKALVLPSSIAMSDAELSAITQFAENGGVVIADALPATHDEHGHRRTKSPAMELFGVQDSADASGSVPAGTRTQIAPTLGVDVTNGAVATSQPISVTHGNAVFSPDVEIVYTPQENAPGIGIRAVGNGKAVLLNFTVQHYGTDRQYGRQQSIPVLFQSLLQRLDIRPAYECTVAGQGGPIQGLELIRHSFAGGELLSVLREDLAAGDNEPRTITLDLAKDFHVIDLQSHQSIGKTRQLEITTGVGAPLLYALLDAPPGEFSVTLPDKVQRGEELTVKLDAALLPTTACRVEWIAPDGSVSTAYSANVLLSAHHASLKIRLALNDPAGTWSVRARNVLTGQTVTETFNAE